MPEPISHATVNASYKQSQLIRFDVCFGSGQHINIVGYSFADAAATARRMIKKFPELGGIGRITNQALYPKG